ncbi:MAG: MAPEG family protein [Marinibacterium sp.]|nr:MAPEG family protein [Marinibacterium sp.]
MSKRALIFGGMVLGLVWALAIVWLPQQLDLPFIPAPVALPSALVAPGVVMLLLIGRLAQRRFFDDDLIDGQSPAPATGASVDQRVLTNTAEQIVLALAIWPFVANSLGGAVVLALGFGFAVARVLFWIGYHISPPLRSLGFAATFYPTIVAAICSVLAWMG